MDGPLGPAPIGGPGQQKRLSPQSVTLIQKNGPLFGPSGSDVVACLHSAQSWRSAQTLKYD